MDTFRIAYRVRMDGMTEWANKTRLVDADNVADATNQITREMKPGCKWSIKSVSMRCRGMSRGHIPGMGRRFCQRFGSEPFCSAHSPVAPTRTESK